MKNSNWLRRTAAFFRMAMAITIVAAGCALALIATHPGLKTTMRAQMRGEPYRIISDNEPGEAGPWKAALQECAHRAYPAADVPAATAQRSHQEESASHARNHAPTPPD